MCSADQVRALPNPRHCRRDHWEDLDRLERWSYEDQDRDTYLRTLASRRAAGSHHLYSLVEHGTLVHYGWLTYPQERAPDAALGLEFRPPAGSAALWDYFTHPDARGRGLYRNTLWQCVHDAVDIDGARQVFIYVYADNAVSRRVIERAGFAYQGSLVLERRFFRTQRYATVPAGRLDVRVLASGHQAETRQHRRTVTGFEHSEEREAVVRRSDQPARSDQFDPGPSRQRAR